MLFAFYVFIKLRQRFGSLLSGLRSRKIKIRLRLRLRLRLPTPTPIPYYEQNIFLKLNLTKQKSSF